MDFLINLFSFITYILLSSSLCLWLAKITVKGLDDLLYNISCAKNGKYKRKYKKED